MSQNPPPPPQEPYGEQPQQPAYGQPGHPQQPGGAYPQQGYGQPAQPRGGAGLAITALVFGILALILFWTIIGGILFGLIALIVGIIAAGKAKRGTARGRGMAITGIVLGVLGAVLSIVLIAIGASFLNSDSGKNLQDCLQNAQTRADQEQCQQDFQDDLTN